MKDTSGNEENIEGQPSSKKCLCGRNGRFRFYKTNDGYLCMNHMQFWLIAKLDDLLHHRNRDNKILACIYVDGKH